MPFPTPRWNARIPTPPQVGVPTAPSRTERLLMEALPDEFGSSIAEIRARIEQAERRIRIEHEIRERQTRAHEEALEQAQRQRNEWHREHMNIATRWSHQYEAARRVVTNNQMYVNTSRYSMDEAAQIDPAILNTLHRGIRVHDDFESYAPLIPPTPVEAMRHKFRMKPPKKSRFALFDSKAKSIEGDK